LNPTKGVENYIVDPVNIMYLSYYKYLPYPSSILSYYQQRTNLYNLYNLASGSEYVVNAISLGVSYKLNENFSIHLTPQLLQSNTSNLNRGSAGQLRLSYTDKYTLSFATSVLSTSKSKGGQGTVTFYYPFLDNFYSSSTLNGQYMTVKTSETVFLSYNPPQTTTKAFNKQKYYGFFQQELGYTSNYFYFGVGGRVGTARTPFMGENWIYTGFDLLYGGYGQVGIKTENLTFQIQYSQDKWLDSRNERPTSHTTKLMLTWRL